MDTTTTEIDEAIIHDRIKRMARLLAERQMADAGGVYLPKHVEEAISTFNGILGDYHERRPLPRFLRKP
jgi:Mor family transcriptional regulator